MPNRGRDSQALTLVPVAAAIVAIVVMVAPAQAAPPQSDGDKPAPAEQSATEPRYEVQKIWDKGPHNAFTGLARFKDRWYCAFREGPGHLAPGGGLRLLGSDDGSAWQSVRYFERADGGLWDARLSTTPSGQLMLMSTCWDADPPKDGEREPQWRLVGNPVWFSTDGESWTDGVLTSQHPFKLYDVAWHGRRAYAAGCLVPYGRPPDARLYLGLFGSNDGRHFDPIAENIFEHDYPNEATMAFLPDGRALCLLRVNGRKGSGPTPWLVHGQLGTASPPYNKWQWRELNVPLGGPCMLRLADGRIVVGTREYRGKNWGDQRLALCWLDVEQARLKPFCRLPSGGDSCYPGIVDFEGKLWVSYYSSHEGRTSIYLAKVER